MEKIFRFFGYVSIKSLCEAVQEYSDEKYLTKEKMFKENPPSVSNFLNALQQGYEGIGATGFVLKFLDNGRRTK